MLEDFVAPLVEPGRVNSLAQTLLKLTAPGVPDTYQGTELWDLSLVDPDNRRPVDYETRARLLGQLGRATVEQVVARSEEGLPKLYLISRALELRRRLPEAFGPKGRYEPLAIAGQKAQHVLGFLRWGVVATVVPRLVMGLADDWSDTTIELPAGSWTNRLTGDRTAGGRVRAADLLGRFPVALLELES
jgi:(1->4)-alpha-D-glucan 1-alpha-D-glucosylmutase